MHAPRRGNAPGPNGQAREEAREAAAAAATYDKRLDELAPREDQAWQEVDELIAATTPREYDQAVALLTDLRALAHREERGDAFAQRLQRLRQRHQRKPSLLRRLDQARLGP